jgi:hypothetical protein
MKALMRTRLLSSKLANRGGGKQYNKTGKSIVNLEDSQVHCLTLHPVSWPHNGAYIEKGLASEALGLVRSLDWQIVKGPVAPEKDEECPSEEEFETRGRIRPTTFSASRVAEQMSLEGIQDGDYCFAPGMQGVYVNGGLVLDLENDDSLLNISDDEEWKDDSLAGRSLVKCRKVSGTTFFTKGKLAEFGWYIKDHPEINVVFVNTTLTTMQQKKLEKRWNDMI